MSAVTSFCGLSAATSDGQRFSCDENLQAQHSVHTYPMTTKSPAAGIQLYVGVTSAGITRLNIFLPCMSQEDISRPYFQSQSWSWSSES